MTTARRRRALVTAGMATIAVVVAGTGTAFAISGGLYSSHRQGCGIKADSNNREEGRQPAGCHDTQVLLRDGNGHTYLELGTDTNSEGHNVHSADIMISPDGSGNTKGQASGSAIRLHVDTHYQPIPENQCGVFDLLTYPIDVVSGHACTLNPAQWRLPSKLPSITPTISLGKGGLAAPDLADIRLYFGADDGLDTGEHDEPNGKDGTRKEQNGPSDGGAAALNWHPLALSAWLPKVVAGLSHTDLRPLAENPLPVADGGAGACADGICFSAQTVRRLAYRGGGGGGKSRDVYDYDGKTWDPYACSGASPAAEKSCHDKTHKNEDAYYRREARHVTVEPGLQVYEDPDPNGSPLLPTYPLPALYLGTCGLTLGGGPLQLPKSALTNHSGQLSLSPTRC